MFPPRSEPSRRRTSTLKPVMAKEHAMPVGSPDAGISMHPAPDPTISYAANVVPDRDSPRLSWNDFLALRQTRRRYNLLASVVCGGTSLSVGLTTLSAMSLDSFNLMGADPLVVMGLSTLATGAAGWLLGPLFGGTAFGIVHRRLGREIAWVG